MAKPRGCDANGVPFPRQSVLQLPAYAISASPSDVATSYGVKEITYLASNENPYGCSLNVREALGEIGLVGHRYPDSDGRSLKAVIADRNSLVSTQVFLGNGSNEILESVARAYLEAGDEVVVSEHSFAMYPIFAKSVGAEVTFVPMLDWFVDLKSIAGAVTSRTKIVYLANANNPTGTMLPVCNIADFLQQLPRNVVVVVDEAYIEFAGEGYGSAIELIHDFPNLLISRTFSKAYGLAGFRIGYGVANEHLVANLEKIQQPFNVNSVAQIAAEAALIDYPFLEAVVEKNRHYRDFLSEGLRELGLVVLPSQANFITFHVPDMAVECYEYLLSCGIIIRPLIGYQMKSWLRVSIGTPVENDQFLVAIRVFFEARND